MTAQLLSTSEGQTLVLTLSNPEFRNALGPEMYAAGVEALSVAESSAEVASSNTKIGGSLSKVRAMATRCFSPADNFSPRSPTEVW